jgi:hypothetical protein
MADNKVRNGTRCVSSAGSKDFSVSTTFWILAWPPLPDGPFLMEPRRDLLPSRFVVVRCPWIPMAPLHPPS